MQRRCTNAHMSEKGRNKDEINDIRKRFPDVFKKLLRIRLERVKDTSFHGEIAVINGNTEFHGGTENHFFSPKFSKSNKGILIKAF